ncbi:hypothetical protein B0T14DRAFT_79229 [Immersiella caudata]|uniref:Uncharacterized protein n=1 Tax=Immersiella caudata TaxID=314043 RepID=A0AA39XGS8_9PEZI|nr:hypothetical protein B0T14DRAFT_79229 [Immersiella caudata]
MLVAVLPGTLTTSEAIQVIGDLLAVLENYNERLGAVAIEIAEQIVSPASGETLSPASANTILPPDVHPSEEIKVISYHKSLSPGASIGPAENQQIAGTLGPFLRIVTDGTPQLFALACSHVLSTSKMLTTHGSDNLTVVRPAKRDNFHWWFAAESVIKQLDRPQITEILEKEALRDAQAQKRRCREFHRPVSTMHASSGLRVSADHWILDWALVKLNPLVVLEKLQNTPSPSSHATFNIKFNLEAHNHTDWTSRAARTAALANGSAVFKTGRTTGHTMGQLHDVDPSVTINYMIDGHSFLLKGKSLVVRPETVCLLATETRVPLCLTAMQKLWAWSLLYPKARWRGALLAFCPLSQ